MIADIVEQHWRLTLYVNGASPRSAEAIVAIRRFCDEDLGGRVDLKVVDVAEHPALMKKDHILALPTLVKHSPGPLRHLVGNLTDTARVRAALDLGAIQVHLDGVTPDHSSRNVTGAEESHESAESQLAELVRQVAHLQEALDAVSNGGVDVLVLGAPESEQVYTLTNADRPYRVIVERMGEGAVTVSDRGVILFANPRLAQFIGIERDGMIGRDITEYVDDDQQIALHSLLETAATETRRGELMIAASDGSQVPVLVAATALDLEGALVRCLVFTDLTMQKQIEHQLVEEAAQAERQRVAREMNDSIVQGLVTAEMALDLERYIEARSAIARTSAQARQWIGELAVDHQVEPGTAVRDAPSRSKSHAP